jgi:hypothetical protein
MAWLRTAHGLTAWLIGLFMLAQLAGVVPFRDAHASPTAAHAPANIGTAHARGDHVHKHSAGQAHFHGEEHQHSDTDRAGLLADQCCALHGLAAIVPVVVAAVPAGIIGERIADARIDRMAGIVAGRLDRPPKHLASP